MNSKKGKSKTILVMDDDTTMLETIKIFLEDENYHIVTLTDGTLLKETIERKLPDLIVMDYLMPGKNGDEITEDLKQQQNTQNIPIIMIAASRQYENAAYKAGVNKFISKPFDIYELLDYIRTYT